MRPFQNDYEESVCACLENKLILVLPWLSKINWRVLSANLETFSKLLGFNGCLLKHSKQTLFLSLKLTFVRVAVFRDLKHLRAKAL